MRCLHDASGCPTLFDFGMSMRCVNHAVAHLCAMIPLPGQRDGPTLFDLWYVYAISSTSCDTSSEGLRYAVAGVASAVEALMSSFHIKMENEVCH